MYKCAVFRSNLLFHHGKSQSTSIRNISNSRAFLFHYKFSPFLHKILVKLVNFNLHFSFKFYRPLVTKLQFSIFHWSPNFLYTNSKVKMQERIIDVLYYCHHVTYFMKNLIYNEDRLKNFIST